MTLPEYNKRFAKVVSKITHNPEVMVKLAIDANSMISKRIIKTGVNAKGQKFKPYSTKSTLIGSSTFLRQDVANKLLGSKEKRKQLEWRTVDGHRLAILEGGYKKIRELQNRQTGYVDFSVTNRMWNDIQVISNHSDHQKGVAIIGARLEDEKKKLAGNTKRRGDILDLSDAEQTKLKELYNLNVLQIFKENGL